MLSRAWRVVRRAIAPLRPLIERFSVTVTEGPLRGRRLLLDARRAFRQGTYEVEQTQRVQQCLRPGDVFYDIGAHVGYYTLLACDLVGPTGKVVAFEPYPPNARRLRRHVTLNRCPNARVIEACVGDQEGTCSFISGLQRGSFQGKVSPDGELRMPMVTLDGLIEAGAIAPPTCMKVDVEGAESLVLRGAARTLARYRPTVLLSVHGEEGRGGPGFHQHHSECVGAFSALGYRLQPIDSADLDSATEILCEPGERPAPGAAEALTPEGHPAPGDATRRARAADP